MPVHPRSYTFLKLTPVQLRAARGRDQAIQAMQHHHCNTEAEDGQQAQESPARFLQAPGEVLLNP